MRGALPTLTRAAAIVGTRRPTERARRMAHQLAVELAQEGCVVVSGGAFGVDHAAHVGALEAGGLTVVVHASGLMACYPAEHRPLYERIVARGGCELSEREDTATPRPGTFLARNRLIAALARVVVVVEAPVRSGALSTAAHAREIGTPVLVVPRVPECVEALGSNDLLRAGALPCLSAADVLRVIEGLPFAPRQRAAEPPRTSRREPSRPRGVTHPNVAGELDLASDLAVGEPAGSVLRAVEQGAVTLEDVVVRVGRPVAEVLAAVAELELRGLLAQDLAGRLELLG